MPFVAAWVGAFAGGFDFHVADEHFAQCDRVIRSGLERGQQRFTDRGEQLALEATKLREISEQPFQRGAKLVLRFAAGGGVRKLCFRVGPEAGDRCFQVKHLRHAALMVNRYGE